MGMNNYKSIWMWKLFRQSKAFHFLQSYAREKIRNRFLMLEAKLDFKKKLTRRACRNWINCALSAVGERCECQESQSRFTKYRLACIVRKCAFKWLRAGRGKMSKHRDPIVNQCTPARKNIYTSGSLSPVLQRDRTLPHIFPQHVLPKSIFNDECVSHQLLPVIDDHGRKELIQVCARCVCIHYINMCVCVLNNILHDRNPHIFFCVFRIQIRVVHIHIWAIR